jgi:16S rRNA C1402 (ribose-2'-O) methylase RsmI
VIACEDTRRTRVLLDRHGIEGTPFPSQVQRGQSGGGIARRPRLKSVVSGDGGTPAVSDPGHGRPRRLTPGATRPVLALGLVAAVSASA